MTQASAPEPCKPIVSPYRYNYVSGLLSPNMALVPAVDFVDQWSGLFSFNSTFTSYLHSQAEHCGYTSFLAKYLTFPPPGPFPSSPQFGATSGNCNLWDEILNAVFLTNPCFDLYQVATTCPLLWDQLGFPGSIDYLPKGASIYFNRTDVQKAINAPVMDWSECASNVFINGTDNSPPSSLSILPGVIERLNRTIIAHGALDYVLLAKGTLLTIQNMTWHGLRGFQSAPTEEFYVPYHTLQDPMTLAGAGIFGTTHTERGLTWVEVSLSGHMVPQYAPSAGYRTLEFMLGRIGSLTERTSFTTNPDGANNPNTTMDMAMNWLG